MYQFLVSEMVKSLPLHDYALTLTLQHSPLSNPRLIPLNFHSSIKFPIKKTQQYTRRIIQFGFSTNQCLLLC